jgi:hypothetical protein
MPFGLKVVPEMFQRKLKDAIADLPGVFAVADDILVAGEGATYQQAVDDHDKKLEALRTLLGTVALQDCKACFV